jgi:prephenate dehydrogenase
MRVAIVGVGLIGGSLGMALRSRRLAQSVVGIGRNPATLDKALHLGAIDEAAADLAGGVRGADLVVLATPIGQIVADLARLPGLLSPQTVVTDVGSTKGEIARAGDRLIPGGAFVAGHPMAGSERSGVEAARGGPVYRGDLGADADRRHKPRCPRDRPPTGAGGRGAYHRSGPDAHDRAVAVTSHLPHVLAYALAALAGAESESNPHLFDLAAGSFASATRVAGSSPELWREIALSNCDALLAAVRAYRVSLAEAEAVLESGDSDALLALFQKGHAARRES